MTEYYFRPTDYATARPEKPYKHTFYLSDRVLVGSNSYMQGQCMPMHVHADEDKCYLILEGIGRFTVGDTSRICVPGDLVVAPAGTEHGVVNEDEGLLTFLTIIAPWPYH